MTDHKAEAELLVDGRAITVAGRERKVYADKVLEVALVHATLYLAEQQRIANLIALLPTLDRTPVLDRMDNDRPLPTELDRAMEVITEGLGL